MNSMDACWAEDVLATVANPRRTRDDVAVDYAMAGYDEVLQVCGLIRDATRVATTASRYVDVLPEGNAELTNDAHLQLLHAVTDWRA